MYVIQLTERLGEYEDESVSFLGLTETLEDAIHLIETTYPDAEVVNNDDPDMIPTYYVKSKWGSTTEIQILEFSIYQRPAHYLLPAHTLVKIVAPTYFEAETVLKDMIEEGRVYYITLTSGAEVQVKFVEE